MAYRRVHSLLRHATPLPSAIARVLPFSRPSIPKNTYGLKLLPPVRGVAADVRQLALPKVVLVKIGAAASAPMPNLLDKHLGTLYDALFASAMCAEQLKGIPLGDAVVAVSVSATDVLDPAARWLQLEGTSTLKDLWLQLSSAGPFLHVHVRRPQDARAVATPQPIGFSKVLVGDTVMQFGLVSDKDGRKRPLFLGDDAFKLLQEFVDDRPLALPQVTVLSGSIKTGKTKAISEVLPAMIFESYRAGKTLRPFILHIEFTDFHRPEAAALAILERARTAAAGLGVHVEISYEPGWAVRNVQDSLRSLAEQLRALKTPTQLWLLMDECQAPLQASLTLQEQLEWMGALKRVVGAVSPLGRVAWTGSAMVTFLNHVRMLPMHGFQLIGTTRFVRLGGTPSPAAANAMAERLLELQAVDRSWPEPVRKCLTPNLIVERLAATATGGILSARPALVAFVLDLMGDVKSETPEQALSTAVQTAITKLRGESRTDFTAALAHLRSDRAVKKALFTLAGGQVRSLDDLGLDSDATKMLSQLCEKLPSPDGSGQVVLLEPPNAPFVTECINEEGDAIVQKAPGRDEELGDKLRGTLNFFWDSYARRQLDQAVHSAAISAAVISSLHANGIGRRTGPTAGRGVSIAPVRCAADIDSVPALSALLRHTANSRNAVEHDEYVAAKDADYDAAIGLHILRWARCVASHNTWAADVFSKCGVPVAVIDAAVRAAAHAVCRAPPWDRHGFFFDDRLIPERKRVLSRR